MSESEYSASPHLSYVKKLLGLPYKWSERSLRKGHVPCPPPMLCAGCDAQFRADTTGCLKSTRSGQTGVHRAPNAVSKAVSFVTLGSYSTSGGLRFFNVKVEVVMPDTHSGGCDGQTALDIHCSWQGTEGAPSLLPRFLLFLTAFFFLILFIYFWLCWVFVSVRGLSLVAVSRGHSSSPCAGLSLSRPLPLRSTGSVGVAHGPSCSAACGIFPVQGSNPCPLHWQADSQPLRHQGSPNSFLT